eukprot:10885435-Alexandrium_andersonii.AAC.1
MPRGEGSWRCSGCGTANWLTLDRCRQCQCQRPPRRRPRQRAPSAQPATAIGHAMPLQPAAVRVPPPPPPPAPVSAMPASSTDLLGTDVVISGTDAGTPTLHAFWNVRPGPQPLPLLPAAALDPHPIGLDDPLPSQGTWAATPEQQQRARELHSEIARLTKLYAEMTAEGTTGQLADEVEAMLLKRKEQLEHTRPLAATIRMLLERQLKLKRQLLMATHAAAQACAKRDELANRLQMVT